MKTIFYYMGMYKHFDNIGENIEVNIFLYLILLNAVRMSSAQRAILYGRLYGRDYSGYCYGRKE